MYRSHDYFFYFITLLPDRFSKNQKGYIMIQDSKLLKHFRFSWKNFRKFIRYLYFCKKGKVLSSAV